MTADSDPCDALAAEAELLGQLGWVRRLAVSLLSDADAAADVVQEVAGEWASQRPAWAERGLGLRRWLARATRSRSVDRLRAERARRRREATRPPGADEAGEAADAVVERLERQQRVAAAVHALCEPYRTAILLRYLDELAMPEIAARTGVAEATVRKRIERGLRLLRTRLDAEFGADARVWGLALIGSAWQGGPVAGAAPAGAAGARVWLLLRGAGLMGGKKLIAAGVSLVAVAVAWWYATTDLDPTVVEAGGRGVVVAESVAAARDEAALRPERVDAAPAAAGATAVDAAATVVIRGYVFVDEQRDAPADLEIAVERGHVVDDASPTVHVDAAGGSWSLAPRSADPLTLWITSAATVPAQIPVPSALLRSGGVFDLYLSSGRTLALTFLDQRTRAPLAGLPFDFAKAIELRRSAGSVLTRGASERHRTDADGRAVLRGIPQAGAVSVTTDLERRDRAMLMQGGATMRGAIGGEPIWQLPLDDRLPQHLEYTILARVPLGEAWALGQVPAWARAAIRTAASGSAGGDGGVRVVARRWSDDDQRRGDPFVLDQDQQGAFELRAQAPASYRVWLERADREPLSAATTVAFEHAGAHAAIDLQPLTSTTVRVRCANVPAAGQLEVLVGGGVGGSGGQARSQRVACAGEPLTVELTAAAGEQVRLALRAPGQDHGKSAWQRSFVVDPAVPEIEIDLAGRFCDVQIGSDVLGFDGDGVVALMACRGGEVVVDERIVVLLANGAARDAVYVPAGRWLYRYAVEGPAAAWPHAVWGVVDVEAGASGPLLLQPRLHLVPGQELLPGRRLDAVDGVSLLALPERLRTVRPAAAGEPVALPIGAVHAALPQPR